jgi:hypothetical protein
MNDDQLDDLKQFIATTVSQTEARLRNDLANKADIVRIEQKIDDGFTGVGGAISDFNDDIDKRFAVQNARFDEYEDGLKVLEKRAA